MPRAGMKVLILSVFGDNGSAQIKIWISNCNCIRFRPGKVGLSFLQVK